MDGFFLFIQVCTLVIVAAICSGLNVSLMTLQPENLRRKAELGDWQAKQILPLRSNFHLTLASILLVNVAAVSATSLVLESFFNGLIAGIVTTLLMVVFGEILPQAWFTRFAMSYCAYLSPLMRLMIIVTYPVSKPLQWLLDRLLGSEPHELHSRQELGMIVSEHLGEKQSELDEDEVEIMRGALQLSEKKVKDITTQLEDVYWLKLDNTIDGHKIEEIKAENRSRIPIFNESKTKCHGVILMKELVDMDFDEEPKQVRELRLHKTRHVGSMTALDTMFRKFIAAHTQLMPVTEDGKIIGIVTIEDLIEEIIGHEIEDEADRARS